jgi:hypothetical protein
MSKETKVPLASKVVDPNNIQVAIPYDSAVVSKVPSGAGEPGAKKQPVFGPVVEPGSKKQPFFGPVVEPGFDNFFKLITLISPFFLVALLVTISIINSDIKGFVYLAGVVLLFVVTMMFGKAIGGNDLKKTCAFWNIGLFQTPSFISALYVFTIVYLLYPMMKNNVFNFPLIILLLLIYLFDIIIRAYKMGCTDIIHITMGSALGLAFTLFYIMLLAKNTELLYYNDTLSSKVACSVPAKQKFKCSVYNNGQLVQSITP